MDDSATGLFVYGTLAPGQANHHWLQSLLGFWQRATVRGRLYPGGVGQSSGYPALDIGDAGYVVEGQIFWSMQLDSYWSELDAFEGPGYQRRQVVAITASGPHTVHVYAMAEKDRRSHLCAGQDDSQY